MSIRAAVPILALAAFRLSAQSVLTYHNDNLRTGYYNSESQLTWSNVNSKSFGLLFRYPVDGFVYAQPLYSSGLSIGGATHNVVIVATENNSVYVFDADQNGGTNAGVLWHTNFNTGPAGVTVTPVPSADVNCADLVPMIGITSTPVIDPATLTIYVVAKTKEVSASGTSYFHRLHALDLTTGKEKFGGPVAIQGSVPGSCGITDGNGNVVFHPLIQHQRPALLLANGTIYIGFGSHCDLQAYNGWLMAYNASTLQQTAILNASPDAPNGDCRGAVWQSGGGPSADPQGNIYTITGNGGFNANRGGRSYGDSLLKLAPGGASITDYFTPFYQKILDDKDYDFGSGAPLLLPDQPGRYPHLAVAAGKISEIYLLNRDSLGQYHPDSDRIVQDVPFPFGKSVEAPYPPPVYANQSVYFAAPVDPVRGFALANGMLSPKPYASGNTQFGTRGAGLSISSDSQGNNAIVWALNSSDPAALYAYKATDLTQLYNSNQAGNRDVSGPGIKFSVPTIAGGKVFVGTANSLAVFGNF